MTYPVCFSSRYSVGVTFLMWSYHWLSGHDTFWHSKFGFCETPENPNTGINAHHFKKNIRSGIYEWQEFILNSNNKIENCSLYGAALPCTSNDLFESVDIEYAECRKFASQHVPLILCVEGDDNPWYFLHNRSIEPASTNRIAKISIDSHQNLKLDNFFENYFDDSMNNFSKNIWDLREFIALNFEHFKLSRSYLDKIDRSINYLHVNCNDLWYHGEDCVIQIFRYINKDILNSRLQHWKNVYHEWQKYQLKILQFGWYLPTIVDSIVNNYNFNLDFLNLNLLQEGVIQGHLIKNHKLNLKSFGLKKFPNNTKDLHVLLEESLHV